METKDLILLMMIPVILISIVVYIDKSPSITGMATAQQEKSNIIGTYSINPSFKAKIDYDLGDYGKIKGLLDSVLDCMEEGKDVNLCIGQAESRDNSFEWSLECDKGAEKILYDFAEFYQNCFDSDDNNCICRKNLELSKDEMAKYDLLNIVYRMELAQDIQSQKIDIKMLEPVELSYSININGRSVWYPNTFILAYTPDRLRVTMIFKYELQEKPYYVPDKKEIILYKNEANSIKSVDFVEQEADELIYPNGKRIKPQNLHSCELKPKNMFRFCVTKKDIVYKFAVVATD